MGMRQVLLQVRHRSNPPRIPAVCPSPVLPWNSIRLVRKTQQHKCGPLFDTKSHAGRCRDVFSIPTPWADLSLVWLFGPDKQVWPAGIGDVPDHQDGTKGKFPGGGGVDCRRRSSSSDEPVLYAAA